LLKQQKRHKKIRYTGFLRLDKKKAPDALSRLKNI